MRAGELLALACLLTPADAFGTQPLALHHATRAASSARAADAARAAVPRSALTPWGRGRSVDGAESEAEETEMSIGDLLRNYGLIALVFHFSVWATTLTLAYTALASGLDLNSISLFAAQDIPLADVDASELTAAADAAGFIGRMTAALTLTEVIGPARLALTVAATPKVSEIARKSEAVREAEAQATRAYAAVERSVQGALGRGPTSPEETGSYALAKNGKPMRGVVVSTRQGGRGDRADRKRETGAPGRPGRM